MPHELTFVKRTDEKGLIQGSVNRISKDEEPWGETIPGWLLYRNGTFNGSWGGAIEFLEEWKGRASPAKGMGGGDKEE